MPPWVTVLPHLASLKHPDDGADDDDAPDDGADDDGDDDDDDDSRVQVIAFFSRCLVVAKAPYEYGTVVLLILLVFKRIILVFTRTLTNVIPYFNKCTKLLDC